MKKRYILLMSIGCLGVVGIGYKIMVHADVFDDIYSEISSLGSQAAECAKVIPAAAELAAKKVAYETAKKAYDVALAVNSVGGDHRIVSLQAEIAAKQAEMAGRTGVSAVGRFSQETVAELGQFVGSIDGKIAHVSYVKVSGNI